ncbi:MAG: slipin family protein [Bdellovibrionota bacterium]
MLQGMIVLVILLLFIFKESIYILKEWESGVVFFLGRYQRTVGPGLKIVIPFFEKLIKIDGRTITMDIPTQDVITKDNVSVKVNAVLYFRVMTPENALIKVENYLYATSQLAQTTLRSVCGEVNLDGLISKREEVNHKIQNIIDTQSDPWGIKVSMVEVKHIDLPVEMQRAMAKEAEAERERRAKIIQSQGEYQAAEKLRDAAKIMGEEEISVQLRYLETLREIATVNNSTVVFPLPIDLLDRISIKNKQ